MNTRVATLPGSDKELPKMQPYAGDVAVAQRIARSILSLPGPPTVDRLAEYRGSSNA